MLSKQCVQIFVSGKHTVERHTVRTTHTHTQTHRYLYPLTLCKRESGVGRMDDEKWMQNPKTETYAMIDKWMANGENGFSIWKRIVKELALVYSCRMGDFARARSVKDPKWLCIFAFHSHSFSLSLFVRANEVKWNKRTRGRYTETFSSS